MFAFPGISLHLLYLTWFSFSKAVKNPKKPETENRWIGGRYSSSWSAWSLYYKACRLRFCFSVAGCFGGALEGRGRLSPPEWYLSIFFSICKPMICTHMSTCRPGEPIKILEILESLKSLKSFSWKTDALSTELTWHTGNMHARLLVSILRICVQCFQS